jgi:phosphatidylinositol alpha-1,6-mannosyltransferase
MVIPQKKILFIYLNAFSGVGGIEKFNACFMKSMHESSKSLSFAYDNLSFIDSKTDELYLPKTFLKPFRGNKIRAFLAAMFYSLRADVIILGHINLLVLAFWLYLFPQKKVILIAHGIEVWQDLPRWKQKLLQKCDLILAVSHFTKTKMAAKHQINLDKIEVFYNTLNPFFNLPHNFAKAAYLCERYAIRPHEKVILTVARLSSAEKYKGYDKVIEVMPEIIKKYPHTKYIIAGKYDTMEFERLINLITEHQLTNHVHLVGFVKDAELIDHYLLADVFVMPSQGEGFGIVYLEAMACGVSVIAGNKDGSVDALQNGRLGHLVNPDSLTEIQKAIETVLATDSKTIAKKELQQAVIQHFGFEQFKEKTSEVIKKILYILT